MKSLHLLYHEIRPEKSRYSYVTPLEEFASHCGLFSKLQAQSTPGQLRPEVSFDDGHRSDVVYALPTLQKQGLRATFFITAGWTGKRAAYMNWTELRELQAAGHSIGAHGLTHKLLTGCSVAELDNELRVARQVLEDGLGTQVTRMSLPGGRANGRVLRACSAAGYNQIFTSVPRAEDPETRPRTVGRLNLVSGTSVEWLSEVLDSRSGALARLERISQVKATAKAVLGDRLYARLWAIGNRQEADSAEAEARVS